MQVKPGVHSFDLEWEYDEPLSVHVLDTGLATVLFGGGSAETGDDLTDVAVTHGVDVVVVEHGDEDHYGAVPALRDAHPDLEVAVPRGDASVLEDAGIEVDLALTADERYWGFRTISTPGHTPDNTAYLHEDTLVAGDTVVGSDSIFASPGEWTGPLAVITREYNDDDVATRESVPRLLDHEFDTVLLSHGDNVASGGYEAVETLVEDLDAASR